jgi:hypothetical protein
MNKSPLPSTKRRKNMLKDGPISVLPYMTASPNNYLIEKGLLKSALAK